MVDLNKPPKIGYTRNQQKMLNITKIITINLISITVILQTLNLNKAKTLTEAIQIVVDLCDLRRVDELIW